jgi:nucleotide-binding universal stress UspA family protein
MLESILVTTDFSLAARRALLRAALLAKESRGRLWVLHVLPERSLTERLFRRDEIDHGAMQAGAQRALQAELQTIRSHTGVQAEALLREGSAQRVIMEVAEELSVGLLVVGAHGEREDAHGRRMLGGTALKCFARTTRPLLFVRKDVVGNYYKIVAAVDDSLAANWVLAATAELGGKRSICQALHVFEAPFAERLRQHDVKPAAIAAYAASAQESAERNLKTRIEKLDGAHITPIVLSGYPGVVLPLEVRERQPDVVVLGKRRRLEDAGVHPDRFFGSVSLRLAFEIDTDVLVVP